MLLEPTGLLVVGLAIVVMIGVAHLIEAWTDPRREARARARKWRLWSRPGRD